MKLKFFSMFTLRESLKSGMSNIMISNLTETEVSFLHVDFIGNLKKRNVKY